MVGLAAYSIGPSIAELVGDLGVAGALILAFLVVLAVASRRLRGTR